MNGGALAVGAEIRRRLGPLPDLKRWPHVSIVVPNRNGVDHLRRLLAGLVERTDYPAFDLVLVDNASSDDSVAFVREAAAPFPISIVANPHNESFSDACNMGARRAEGTLLLILNNDVEPLEPGWLRELVQCWAATGAGIAGATLLLEDAEADGRPHRVQHRGIWISEEENGLLGPDRSSFGEGVFESAVGEDAFSPVPSGACMLIEAELYRQVGGFTHGYVYGGEDVDLGLKVAAAGRRVICSGRCFLLHRLRSTLAKESEEHRRQLAEGNRRLFWGIWGPRLRREYELDRLAGGGRWAAPGAIGGGPEDRGRVLALSFCLRGSEPKLEEDPARDTFAALASELAALGHRCRVATGGDDDLRDLEYDVAVHLHGRRRHIPVPGRLNVLWAADPDDTPTPAEADRYDLLLTGPIAAGELVGSVESRVEELRLPLRIEPEFA